MAREEAQVLAHFGGTGGAVEPDHVDPERRDRGQGGTDLRAEQHRAGRLDRHGDDHRQFGVGCGQCAFRADDRGLGLQQVLRRLDQHGVDATGDHAADLGLVRVAQRRETHVPKRRQLRAGSDRAEDPAWRVGRAVRVRSLAGDPGRGLGELLDPVLDAVLGEVGEIGAERVRLDAVHADGEVPVVHRGHDVRSGHAQDLVAALETVEVGQGQVGLLQHRAHRAIGDDDALGEGRPQGS